MTPSELLRFCASAIEHGAPRLTLSQPKDGGRFPFSGGDTELLSVNEAGTRNYSVSVPRILRHVAKWAADQRDASHE